MVGKPSLPAVLTNLPGLAPNLLSMDRSTWGEEVCSSHRHGRKKWGEKTREDKFGEWFLGQLAPVSMLEERGGSAGALALTFKKKKTTHHQV